MYTNVNLLAPLGALAITHFVIGHENSFLHKKTRFQI